MQSYDAVVYDLDGTLVYLTVDWNRVERELADHAADAGVDPAGMDAWGLLDAGEAAGIGDEMEAIVSEYELRGARASERLADAEELVSLDVPASVCSLNCEAACRTALDVHDLASHVESVVGRDTVTTRKPDPEPLLAALAPLDVPPERALFVGDSERDAVTAERAGMDFRYVDGTGPAD